MNLSSSWLVKRWNLLGSSTCAIWTIPWLVNRATVSIPEGWDKLKGKTTWVEYHSDQSIRNFAAMLCWSLMLDFQDPTPGEREDFVLTNNVYTKMGLHQNAVSYCSIKVPMPMFFAWDTTSFVMITSCTPTPTDLNMVIGPVNEFLSNNSDDEISDCGCDWPSFLETNSPISSIEAGSTPAFRRSPASCIQASRESTMRTWLICWSSIGRVAGTALLTSVSSTSCMEGL